MATKQGFRNDGTDSFVYQELSAGTSVAIGMDDSDSDILKVVTQTTAGANPSGTAQLQIDPTANGDITITPNGTGAVDASKTTDDPYFRCIIPGSGNAFALGMDDSDNDSLKLVHGAAPTPSAGSTIMEVTTTGETTFPLQPAFLGILESADVNVTGNGTVYTLGTNVAFTEIYDQNGDFNTNGTFTAPVDGIYHFTTACRITNFGGNTSYQVRIVGGGRSYIVYDAQADSGTNLHTGSGSAYIQLTAAQTVVVNIVVNGVGADTVDVEGEVAPNAVTFFGGKLVA